MAIPIRPEDLPAGSPTNTAAIPYDSGTQVFKATPIGIVDAAIPLASQAEAEAGIDNTKRVTSLRVAQAIDFRGYDPAIAARPTSVTLAAAGGSALVGFQQIGTGASLRTVDAKLKDAPLSIEDYRLTGETDQQALVKALARSAATGKPIDIGGPDVTVIITEPLIITAPNVVIFGSGGKIIMDHTATGFVRPMIHVQAGATGFKSWGIRWDHDAQGVTQPVLGNQVAFAYCMAIILSADEFEWSGEVYNSWDNGVGVGNFSFTGTGTLASPIMGTQVTYSPIGWYIDSIYGENCGCGEHNYVPAGEYGKKGAVLNILTAADGAVGSASGRGNYNGLTIDFAGGAELSVGPCAFSGTILDAAHPNNGSGIDLYLAAGPVVIPAFKSDNAGRCGIAITPEAGPVVIGANVHASSKEAVFIDGGIVTGSISVSDSGQLANNTYDAVKILAASANTKLNLQISVRATDPSGNQHRYAYTSSESGGFKISGHVHLVADAGGTGPVNRAGSEVLHYAGVNTSTIYGYLGVGTIPVVGATSTLFTAGDVTVSNAGGAFMANLYYDGAWKHRGNGYGFVLRQDNGTGAITLLKSTNNASGPNAAASLTTVGTW